MISAMVPENRFPTSEFSRRCAPSWPGCSYGISLFSFPVFPFHTAKICKDPWAPTLALNAVAPGSFQTRSWKEWKEWKCGVEPMRGKRKGVCFLALLVDMGSKFKIQYRFPFAGHVILFFDRTQSFYNISSCQVKPHGEARVFQMHLFHIHSM